MQPAGEELRRDFYAVLSRFAPTAPRSSAPSGSTAIDTGPSSGRSNGSPPSPRTGGRRRFFSEAAHRNDLTVRLGGPWACHPAAPAVGKGVAPGPAHTLRIPRPVLTPRQGSGQAPPGGRPCLAVAASRWGSGSPPSLRWLPPLPPPVASSSPRLSAVLPCVPAMPWCWSTCRWPMPLP
jgi:hypothetical protein